jgi:hypothetical protein
MNFLGSEEVFKKLNFITYFFNYDLYIIKINRFKKKKNKNIRAYF